MQNTLGTLVAIAFIAGGFLLTGDLGWCARRGLQLVQRAPVDAATERVPPASPEAVPETPAPEHAPADNGPSPPPPVEAVDDDPLPAVSPARHAPPTDGPERIELAKLAPGARLVLWSRPWGRAATCHVCDLIDPSTGEVLIQRRNLDGAAGAGGTAPWRGRIVAGTIRPSGDPEPLQVTRGGSLQVVPVGLAHDRGGSSETIGPIVALTVD